MSRRRCHPSRLAALIALAATVLSVLVAQTPAQAALELRCYVGSTIQAGTATGTGVFSNITSGGIPPG